MHQDTHDSLLGRLVDVLSNHSPIDRREADSEPVDIAQPFAAKMAHKSLILVSEKDLAP